PKRSEPMKSDAEIRDDVINELHWDPQVTEPEAIGVAVKDGAVTLTGHVPSYAEKLAAARAAERVYGVKAVANDLKVQFSRAPRDDSDVATAIAHILEWNVQIPEGKVHARVENGWVTLDGEWTTPTRSARSSGWSTTSAGWPGCGTSSPSGRRPARRPSRRPSSRPSGARPRWTRGTSRSR
ncbi:MAG TPA: BON domain-containing protein, partial [Streptosporangiaceae bacterium]